MDRNLISVVVTCHNDGAFVKKAVQSIRSLLPDTDAEIVLVDDASTDPFTIDQLTKLGRLRSVEVVRNKKNVGVQRSRARGVSVAESKYITFLDGDDLFEKTQWKNQNYLEFSIDTLERRDDVAFCHCLSEMTGQYNGPTISSYPLFEELVVRKHHVPTFIVFRKTDYPGHDEEILKWQDWSFGVSLLAKRWRHGRKNRIQFYPKFAHRYRIHGIRERLSTQEISEFSQTLRTVSSNLEYFQQFFYGDATEIAKNIVEIKPNRLIELLYVSQWSFDLAISMVALREADISGNFEAFCVP
jgi:glycosyltransferase involved in cell wall biosynthesis